MFEFYINGQKQISPPTNLRTKHLERYIFFKNPIVIMWIIADVITIVRLLQQIALGIMTHCTRQTQVPE